MYEYPELNSINAMDKELFEALKHDPLLHQCYTNYHVNYNPKPFDYKKFYVYLSYMALSMNQRHIRLIMSDTERAINSPIVIMSDDTLYNKDEVDRLIEDNKRGYWQKLWSAILGR